MIRTVLLAAAALTLAAPAFVAPAFAAQVTETVDIAAPPAAVWPLLTKFDGIANWLPGVASSPATKDTTIGSSRTITLAAPGNPTVKETLTAHTDHSYSYKIDQVDPAVLPVTGYTSTISVAKHGTGSTVTWHGNFKPAGGATDATSEKAVSGLYRSGLDNIKKLAEANH